MRRSVLVAALTLPGCGGLVAPAIEVTPMSVCGPSKCAAINFRRERTGGRDFAAEWLSTKDLVMFELNTTKGLIREVPPDGWVNITPEKDAAEVCSDVLETCGWVPYVDTRSTEVGTPPLGVWVDSHGNQAYVSTDVACSPSGHCEQVVSHDESFLVTDEGAYEWALSEDRLRLCLAPCSESRFSSLTNSYGWASWSAR